MHCSFCQLSVVQTRIRLCVVHWVLTSHQLCLSHLRHLTPSLHSLACIWYSEPSTPPDDHTLGCLYWYRVPIRNTSGYLVACIWYSDHNLSSALEITSSLPTQGVRFWSCTLLIAHSCGPLCEEASLGFVDPKDVLRGCHLIPAFAKGRHHSNGVGVSRCAKDGNDYTLYYVGQYIN